ncbi:MAG: hypothetical protein LAN36_15980 [Acidobacteriia bacterium]|nr:hypothetical protein [Terriglobia bacterium]
MQLTLRKLSCAGLGALLVLFTVTAAVGDHLEPEQRARGKVESLLCGINVNWTPIARVLEKYGKPIKLPDYPNESPNPPGGGERKYEWDFESGITMVVYTMYSDKPTGTPQDPFPAGEYAYAVDVKGSSPRGELGRTGRGLALGDTLDRVKRIYGPRFLLGQNTLTRFNYVVIQWIDPRTRKEDDTTMDIDFDSHGRISHIELAADVE